MLSPATGISFPRWRKCIPAFTLRRSPLWCRPCWLSFCCLLGGSFRQFFSLAIFAEWLFYMIAGTTVFVFRRRDPEAVRPYRVWGYPVVPALFVLASAVLLYFTLRDNLSQFGIWLPGHSGRHTCFLRFCLGDAASDCLNFARWKCRCFQAVPSPGLRGLLKDTPAGHVYPSPLLP